MRGQKQRYHVGDLVQMQIANKHSDRFINGIVTKTNDKYAFVSYCTAKENIQRKFHHKDLYILNKVSCSNV